MWTEILKAKFLPEKDPQKWLRILESREAVEEFTEELKGDFETRGINNTIDFLQGGETSQNRISRAITDEDEDEVMDNYIAFHLVIADLLEERLERGMKSRKELGAEAGQLGAEAGTKEAATRKLRTQEQFISTLESIISDPTPEKKQLAETFLEEHSDWLNRRTEGQTNRSRMRNKFGYALTGADFSTKEWDAAITSGERLDVQFKNLHRLFKIPKKAGGITKKNYRINEITPHLAAEFYSLVWDKKLIPKYDDLKGVYGDKKTLKINPFVITLLENENPFPHLAATQTMEQRTRKILERDFNRQPTELERKKEVDVEWEKISGFLQPRDIIVPLEFIRSLPKDEIRDGTLEEQRKLFHNLPEEGSFELAGQELYSFGGAANIKRQIIRLWELKKERFPGEWADIWEEEGLSEEAKLELKNLTEATKSYEGVAALLVDNPDIVTTRFTRAHFDTRELEHRFTGNPLDLLEVIVELDEALGISGEDLIDITDTEVFAKEAEERIPLIRDRLVELVKEKIEEMLSNQREYMLMTSKRAGVKETETSAGRKATTIFSLLKNKGLIDEVN
jgi:hypothetical protein